MKLGFESLGFLIHPFFDRLTMNIFFIPSALGIFRIRKKNTWVAQSFEDSTLDFDSGQGPRVVALSLVLGSELSVKPA